MKKFFTLLVFALSILGVKAEVETTIWTGPKTLGSWGGFGDLAYGSYNWSSVEAGTILRIYAYGDEDAYTASGNTNGMMIAPKHGTEWGDIEGFTSWKTVTTTEAGYDYELTESALADLTSNSGLIVQGNYVVVTKVCLVEDDSPTYGTIFTGSNTLNWGQDVVISSSKFANLKVGDIIRITGEATTSNDQAILKTDWSNYLPGTRKYVFSKAATQDVVITKAALEVAKTKGVFISGANAKVTKVEIVEGTTSLADNVVYYGSVSYSANDGNSFYGITGEKGSTVKVYLDATPSWSQFCTSNWAGITINVTTTEEDGYVVRTYVVNDDLAASLSDFVYQIGSAVNLIKITVDNSTAVTAPGDQKYFSYITPCALDFTGSGLKAYIATAFNNTYVTVKEVTKVPADTPIILLDDGNTSYTVNWTESATSLSENILGCGTNEVCDGLYALNEDGDFAPVSPNVAVPTNKVCIMVDGGTTAKTLRIVVDGATGITEVGSAVAGGVKKSLENGRIVITNGDKAYSVSGARVK